MYSTFITDFPHPHSLNKNHLFQYHDLVYVILKHMIPQRTYKILLVRQYLLLHNLAGKSFIYIIITISYVHSKTHSIYFTICSYCFILSNIYIFIFNAYTLLSTFLVIVSSVIVTVAFVSTPSISTKLENFSKDSCQFLNIIWNYF